jgi:hypothetical protein
MMETVLSQPRVWVRLGRRVPVRNENSNTSGFSPGNEKLVMWLGYSRVRKTENMTQLQSGKDNSYCDQVIVW